MQGQLAVCAVLPVGISELGGAKTWRIFCNYLWIILSSLPIGTLIEEIITLVTVGIQHIKVSFPWHMFDGNF